MSEQTQIAPGETVADRYRINRVLGEGGMGVVYAAEHMLMRKEVALKVLHGDMNSMPEIVARFEREAIAAAAIDHPNVAGATDFGRLPDGACYLVLELLKGESLRDEIKKGPMPLSRALIIMRGIVNGVAAAHAKGIVHRDLKPENVMLVDRDGLHDFVKVLDFGIAKMDTHAQEAPEGQQIVTRIGTIFGTPEYMAPEQAVGDKVDARADIFALGVVFLEMLTGKGAFKGEILNVLRERILMMQMPDMTGIDERVQALITKMMQRHPDDRVQTAMELLSAIDALEAQPTPAPPASARSIVVADPNDMTPPLATSRTLLESVNPAQAQPRWLIPAAAGGAIALVLIIIAFTAGGSDNKDKSKVAASASASNVVANVKDDKKDKRHGAASAVVAAKQTPPPPEPEPSESAEAEPAASVAPSSAPTLKPDPAPAPGPQRQGQGFRKKSNGGPLQPLKDIFK